MTTRTAKPKPKAKMGRPRTIDREGMIRHISEGGTVRGLIAKGFIKDRWTLSVMLDREEDFAGQYARAEVQGATAAIEEAREIVDAAKPADSRVADIRARHRYWVAERRDPRRWGNRQMLEHAGKDGGPIQSAVTVSVEGVGILTGGKQEFKP